MYKSLEILQYSYDNLQPGKLGWIIDNFLKSEPKIEDIKSAILKTEYNLNTDESNDRVLLRDIGLGRKSSLGPIEEFKIDSKNKRMARIINITSKNQELIDLDKVSHKKSRSKSRIILKNSVSAETTS